MAAIHVRLSEIWECEAGRVKQIDLEHGYESGGGGTQKYKKSRGGPPGKVKGAWGKLPAHPGYS